MTSQEYTTDDLLMQRELLQSFPQLTSTLVDIKQDIFDTLEAKAREIYDSPQRTAMDTLAADKILHVISPGNITIDNDRNREVSISQKEKTGEGFFRIDRGTASSRYGDMLHSIDPSIEFGDRICALHIEPVTPSNNPDNTLSVGEMYILGYKWLQKVLLNLPEDKRPKFIVCCSHLSSNFAKKYPRVFHNFPLSLELQYQTSPYKYIFSDSSPHTTAYVGDLEIKKELLLMKNIEELSHGEQEYLQKLNDEMAKNEAYIKMREAYSMYDIGLAVARVEDFLNYDFGG